ncbi:unnamed protein product, partial [Musa hybrid cultivar]
MDFRADHVPLYANKVGPFHNPSETFRSYDLPFCSPGYSLILTVPSTSELHDESYGACYELYFLEEQQSKKHVKRRCCKVQTCCCIKGLLLMICLYGV